ncbi:MAG: hypothetical protein E6230_28175 [Paenibacillus dendritiformis]|uniref:hypothetical protein n=1 Tax=Paenibacillus dendritiformis TaxID=130049 RepID=UPI00143D12D8|nr:hypothetical protein [Paenibacillus dendritiformis]MDU5146041.1 hypothetical protein [Paenibacillus dendritiformis]NKI24806.1 hypothetical protein [Paenibacillus dendritiformis]NRG01161.1 hypothetical protein [Paenibacillus dendritiformis]
MAEKLFGFGFGYLIRLLRGDLSPALLVAAGSMLVLAAAVEVWGKRRYQAWIQAERGSHSIYRRKLSGLAADSLLSMAGALVVWGVIYGMLVLAKGAFPAWGWPEQTVASPALAWLSLLVAYSIIIGFGCLHLLFIGRRLSFSPFWIGFGTAWMVLVACAFLGMYPLDNTHIGAYALCGFISAAATLLLWGLREAEAKMEKEAAEDREAVKN